MLSYVNWKNMIVGGGSISNCMNKNCKTDKINDVDIFIYGLTEEEGKDKVIEIIETIEEYSKERMKSKLHILKNENVITLIPEEKREVKIQLILRLYKCIYEILAGFDIDSSAIAYDGRDVYFTGRSQNAFRTGYNVVD